MAPEKRTSPPSHDITCSAEYLGETGDDDIRIRQHIHVDEGPYRLVTDHCEMILIRKAADAMQVRSRTQRVRWDFAEETGD